MDACRQSFPKALEILFSCLYFSWESKNGGRNERREFMKLKKNVSSPIQKLDFVSYVKNVKRYFLRILEAEFVRKMQKREINGNLMVIYD